MQTKYKIDRDTRTLILKYIRKYDEYRKWIETERDRILYPSPKIADGMPRGGNKEPVLSAIEALEKLEKTHKARVVYAIDQAKNGIGADIADDRETEHMQRAIWLSCLNPREYPFEAFAGLIPYERRQFYKLKNAFLNDIKIFLGL